MKLARGARILMLAGAFLLALVAPAAATTEDGYGGYGGYGNSGSASIPSGTETVLFVGTADADGKFRYPYQVPDEVESSFDIFLRGISDDGDPFETSLASVTPSFAGRTVVLTGQNLQPGSEFTLFAVSEEVAPAGPSAEDDDAEAGTSPADNGDADVTEQSLANLGDESSNNRIIGGVMVVALLIAAAVVYGLRLAGRESY